MKTILMMILFFSGCSNSPAIIENKEKVILVHGYGRSISAMKGIQDYLNHEGYQVIPIGYSSLTQDLDGIKKEFIAKVDSGLNGREAKVHFVGHSFGGLMIRNYLAEKTPKNLGNVVILGTPNKGTPLVDYIQDKWYYGLTGPALINLSSKGSVFLSSLQKPFYNLGVIAGNVSSSSRNSIFSGANDGLVPVESTKVDGMKDFIILPVNHYSMRSHPVVNRQIHHFLSKAEFIKVEP
ncbi:MAG: alpha/beta fold hydrolase [Bdellovibrionota bacterium]